MRPSRLARCGRLCWRNTSPPPPRLCMSLAAPTWSFRCIVRRLELIMRFLLAWFPPLPPSLPSHPPLLCEAFTDPADGSLSLWSRSSALPSLALDSNQWNSSFAGFWRMAAIIRLLGREIAFTVNGRAMGGCRAVAAFQLYLDLGSIKECVCTGLSHTLRNLENEWLNFQAWKTHWVVNQYSSL